MERVRYYVEPFDILFLRGNKLFGAPGSFGESLMPPWPSVVAGALRSAMLAARGHDFAAFAHGEITSDAELGTPAGPGTFTVTAFDVARRYDDGRIETVHALPADLVVHTVDVQGVERTATRRLTPWPAAEGILSSARTSSLGVLAEPRRGKPATGRWLTATGWTTHLAGRGIDTQQHLVSSADLWTLDTRIGIALDPVQRKAADGALFTSQAVALRKREHATQDTRRGGRAFDVGFLAEVAGATLPDRLTLRFGGDGRAALATLDADGRSPHPDYDAIARTKRCRLILTTPGLFAGGWRPTGVCSARKTATCTPAPSASAMLRSSPFRYAA